MKKDILIYFDLITSLKTVQETSDFISQIDSLNQTFFKSEKTSMIEALKSIGKDSAKKIMQTFTKNNLDISNRETVIDFFDTLKNLIKKFKIIKLVLAFDPTYRTIENIHSFVKENIGIGYILDIEVSENILGGAVVIFDGKYNDFTVKKAIEDTFTLKSKEILQFYK